MASGTTMAISAAISEFFGAIIKFPLWWYVDGLQLILEKAQHSAKFYSSWTGLGVWSKNLTVPMYGDTSRTGRIISFFVRLVIVMLLGVGFLFWMVFVFLGVVVYLLIFPLAIIGIFYHAFGGLF